MKTLTDKQLLLLLLEFCTEMAPINPQSNRLKKIVKEMDMELQARWYLASKEEA